MDNAVPLALTGRGPTLPMSGLNAQFTGFTRSGKRYVYGSYFPKLTEKQKRDSIELETIMVQWGKPNPLRWREQPMWICHGGPGSFGVEYSLDLRRIEKLEFDVGPP